MRGLLPAGGRGGLASNVYVSVSPPQRQLVRRWVLPSLGGHAGAGGNAPTGVTAGPGMAPGLPGDCGRPGVADRSRPAPTMFLNKEM